MFVFLWNWIVCMFVPFAGSITLFIEGIVGKDTNGRKIKSHVFHILLAFLSLGIDLLLAGYGGNLIRAALKIFGRPFMRITEKTALTAVRVTEKTAVQAERKVILKAGESAVKQGTKQELGKAVRTSSSEFSNLKTQSPASEKSLSKKPSTDERKKLLDIKEKIGNARESNIQKPEEATGFENISNNIMSTNTSGALVAKKIAAASTRDPELGKVATKNILRHTPQFSGIVKDDENTKKETRSKEKLLRGIIGEKEFNKEALQKLGESIISKPEAFKNLSNLVLKLPETDLVKSKPEVKKSLEAVSARVVPIIENQGKSEEENIDELISKTLK